MRIQVEHSLAIIIDIQERLFPHMHERDVLEQNAGKAIEGLEVLSVPLWLTQQYTRGLGPTIDSIRRLVPDIEPIEKIAFSCCGEPAFMARLQEQSRKTILLLGIEAHVCVLQTAIDLLQAGYVPVVIEDCVSSRKARDRDVALKRLYSEGIRTTTYESLLFELCRQAGSDTFKRISGIVK